MRFKKFRVPIRAVSLIIFLLAPKIVFAAELPLHNIRLPEGFKIEIYTDDVPNARSMLMSPGGILYVGTINEGNLYAVIDKDNDKKADKVITLIKVFCPNGVAYRDGDLYFSNINSVWRFDDIDANVEKNPKPVLVTQAFPEDILHGWKFIAFGPDGKLYVPVGAPCNVCEREDLVYASIMRMDPEGKNIELFAQGIRNTVGFDWHPETQELWFTENGRDDMGDDLPPDELNRAPKMGLHFGFPYCSGKRISDSEFGDKIPCQKSEPPVRELDPHAAPLGMRFYTGDMFPQEYRNQIFIAEHGSRHRSKEVKKNGYRLSLVRLEGNKAASYEPFAEGWLMQDGTFWGRPVDVLVIDDGSLLVSDDWAGVIYRITYSGR